MTVQPDPASQAQAAATPYVDPFVELGRQTVPDDKAARTRGDYAAQIMGALITHVSSDKDISLEITKQLAIHAVNAADLLLLQLAKTTDKRAGQ